MSGWLLAIVGIISVGVLLEILLPEGETNKYIKGIFAIAVVLVIVAPLPKLIGKDFNFENLFSGENYQIDQSYAQSLNTERNVRREEQLKGYIKSKGYKVEKVRVGFDFKDYNKIDYVKVYLEKVNGIDKEGCLELVMKFLSVNKEDVYIYG